MLRILMLATLMLGLSACSSAPEWKAIYTTEEDNLAPVELDVPPDLDKPVVSTELTIPAIGTAGSTYSAYTQPDGSTVDSTQSLQAAGIRIKRDGALRWLEIDASVDELWPELKSFFQKVGFNIERADKTLGVMETNWLESRDSMPSNWFTKMIDKIYSSGYMDKYRARLENTNDPKITLLFITHRGVEEKATDVSAVETADIWWQPRPSDPELEAEMLQRFLVFRNIDKQVVKQQFAQVANQRSTIIENNNEKFLKVNEGFARTWRRVGIALDRMGFRVDDRNRSSGVYYVTVPDDFLERSEADKSWFANLFSASDSQLATQYVLNVTDKVQLTEVSIAQRNGQPANTTFVERFLSEIKVYLD